MDNGDKKVNNPGGSHRPQHPKDMKEKILIIGRPGTGKTDLGNVLSELMNYDLVDEVPSAWRLSLNSKSRTVYVSNSITEEEAAIYLKEFTVIAVSNL